MKFILDTVMFICALAVANVLIMQLVPNGNLKNSVCLFVSIVMLFMIFSKTANVKNADFSDWNKQKSESHSIYLSGANKAFAQSLENNINQSVKEEFGLENTEVCVVSDVGESYEFEVISVMIYADETKYEIRKYISDEYKIDINKIILNKRR